MVGLANLSRTVQTLSPERLRTASLSSHEWRFASDQMSELPAELLLEPTICSRTINNQTQLRI